MDEIERVLVDSLISTTKEGAHFSLEKKTGELFLDWNTVCKANEASSTIGTDTQIIKEGRIYSVAPSTIRDALRDR